MNLTALANKFDSDKGTTGGRSPHRYTYVYDLIFYHLRNKKINFLEIGLCRGGPELHGDIDREAWSPSIEMWKEYFPNANIIGFDISDFSGQEDDRFSFIRGDSGKEEDMVKLSSFKPYYDVILEDASHASYHQQMAIKHLWAKLSSGGMMIIEDTNWQPPHIEEAMPSVPKTTEFLQAYFENGDYIENELLSKQFMDSLASECQAISFFPHIKEHTSTKIKLIILMKK